MSVSNEQLMAYADGELDDAARAAVEAAIASDPQVARQVEHYRAQRNRLQTAFDGVLDEQVPDRLLNAARGTRPTSSAGIVDLAKVRAEKNPRAGRKMLWPIAASLLIGLLAGRFALRDTDQAMIASTASGMLARGALDEALSKQLASDGAAGPVSIGLSFRSRSGEYCRTFALPRSGGVAGVACRQNDQWRMQTLVQGAAAPADPASYRMAGTALPEAVLRAVQDNADGEPLDAEAEKAAKQRGWAK